jgi:Sigma-70 region 2
MIDADEVLRISSAVARRYARRVFWADVEELTSEACVAVIEAHRTWDPEVGVPFDGYAARAAALRLRTALWRESSPVSGGMNDPRKNLRTRRVFLDDNPNPDSKDLDCASAMDDSAIIPEDEALSRSPVHEERPSARDELEHHQWCQQVRDRFAAIAGATKDGHLATRVLVDGQSSGEVIAETGGRVYQAVHLVRRKARVDRGLYELWQEAP